MVRDIRGIDFTSSVWEYTCWFHSFRCSNSIDRWTMWRLSSKWCHDKMERRSTSSTGSHLTQLFCTALDDKELVEIDLKCRCTQNGSCYSPTTSIAAMKPQCANRSNEALNQATKQVVYLGCLVLLPCGALGTTTMAEEAEDRREAAIATLCCGAWWRWSPSAYNAIIDGWP